MTRLSSEKKQVNYSSQDVFNFIGDFNHFQSLLPEERIENWQCTEDTCSFRIKGMTDLGLKHELKEEPEKIVMVSHGKNPFPFNLIIHIVSLDENKSEVHIDFEGEINPFMKMMVEKPLSNFFNMLVEKLTTLKLT